MQYMQRIIKFIKAEPVLFILILLLLILSIMYPHQIRHYPYFIDWNTIVAITGLLIITTALNESRVFYVLSQKILIRQKKERTITIFLVILSIGLSTFLTNDVTLFIIIPLTLNIQKFIKNDISKLIILEAIAVNVGSSLTPIGNPQNIILWHKWNISFGRFVIKMIPLFIVSMGVLLLFSLFISPDEKLSFIPIGLNSKGENKSLFILSIIALILFVIFLDMKLGYVILIPVTIIYFLFYRNIFKKVDWLLLLLFIIIFIDFHIISTIPAVSNFANKLNLSLSKNVFLFSAFSSQIISNVPASIFVSKFSHNWLAITYGVNIGGNGLIIGSLANIIALRMANNKKLWVKFHIYSIPYFIITGSILYGYFYLL